MFAIRVTKSSRELAHFFDKLDQVTERYVFYEHNVPNNIHIHGLIVGCTVSTDTLKNYIRKDVGNMKSTDWSFKTADDFNFITYMSKGTLDPVVNKGFTGEELQEYRSKWVTVESKKRTMTQYKLKIENPSQAKIRQNELMDMVLQRCRERGITHGAAVLEVIREVVYVEHKTIVGRYKIRDYYDYVVGQGLAPELWIRSMEKLIYFKDT